MRRWSAIVVALFCATLLPGAVTATGSSFTPGAPGAGDPYYPLDGNGGYDVRHYDLNLKYQPATDILKGTETISARATQNLSSFNLDLVGLNVRSIKVDGRRATWTRDGQELVITPRHGLRKHAKFTVVIRYDGIPEPTIEFGGEGGFFATDDGAIIAGQPHGAATWFPANDHPTDKASFSYKITAPKGLEVVANGKLTGRRTHHGWTTWSWNAKEPMATYLATMNIGEFDIDAYRKRGISYWDAIDPDLLAPVAVPTTGSQFALSDRAHDSYKRLMRTVHIPAGGASVGFAITRSTETNWDFTFVEVHTVGTDDWTTLEDVNDHTSQDTGFSCPFGGWQGIHPFLAHYQTDNGDGTCDPTGSTGSWWAATGRSLGSESWLVNIAGPARDVELAITYASDEVGQENGVFVDDIVVSTGEGSTSFEADGDQLDGWTVPGAPTTSPGNDNDWFVGTVADTPDSEGVIASNSFARQPEVIKFLGRNFTAYPFSASGGIVDDSEALGFALETQTRPIYSRFFFSDPINSDNVVVHELAHQWYGDSLAVERWQHIWLNEGFATYAEWLWSEREGLGTVQENFDFWYGLIPDDDPFWAVTIGDPGPDSLFDFSVYARGAMTLQQLRLAVGDHDFFRILKRWARDNAGGNVSTDEFIALAERISGQDLDDLFKTWLFTPTKPVLPAAALRTMGVARLHATANARSLLERYGGDLAKRLTD
jgi:hypothetical protein